MKKYFLPLLVSLLLLAACSSGNDTEESQSEPSKNDDKITLYPIREDISELYKDRWDKSADVPYPLRFPDKVTKVSDHVFFNGYGQTIQMTKGTEISYTATNYLADDMRVFCIDNDLKLEKTTNKLEYYYHLFDNEVAKLAFVRDDWCYSIEGKGFTKEELFDVADSLEIQGKRPTEIPLAAVKFPTKLPNRHVEIPRIHVSQHDPGSYVFHVEYRGTEDELRTNYAITKNEPPYYDHNDTVPIELGNSMEGFYNAENLILFMYDNTYYYTIHADVRDDVIEKLGGREKIKDALIEIGNNIK